MVLISLGLLPNLYQLNKCLVLLSLHVINLYLHKRTKQKRRKAGEYGKGKKKKKKLKC